MRQIYLDESSAEQVAAAAAREGIRLSAHAPYYLNLNALEPQKRRASMGILHKAARIARLAGAGCLVFHPGYYMNIPGIQVSETMFKYLVETEQKLQEEGTDIALRPETSGKRSQFGSLRELMDLCGGMSSASPCIDFAHLHAYGGQVNSYNEFTAVLNDLQEGLGRNAIDNLHLHVSGIHYGHHGEIRHLQLDDSDFNYHQLLRALLDKNAGGMVICESPDSETDALLLKRTYLELRG